MSQPGTTLQHRQTDKHDRRAAKRQTNLKRKSAHYAFHHLPPVFSTLRADRCRLESSTTASENLTPGKLANLICLSVHHANRPAADEANDHFPYALNSGWGNGRREGLDISGPTRPPPDCRVP
jgi:hypothetical protein